MKKFLLAIIMILCAAVPSMAQHRGGGEMNKEVQEFKVKFLAQEMDLSKAEQKKFEEVYNKYTEEKRAAFKDARALEKKVKHAKNATDADYAAVTDAMSKAKAKDAEIEARYEKKFASFLSKKQIYKMKEGEEKFRHKMREMRKNKKNHK